MQVFISRDLSPNSVFRQELESRGIQVVGISLVTLSPISFSTLPACDWIFFSSKNGVKYFFEQITEKKQLSGKKWGAIGPGTAAALQTIIPTIDFVGNGDPADCAASFYPYCIQQTVLFPSAKQTRAGVQQFLPPEVQCLPLTVYDNRAVTEPPRQTADVLVFTSPLNAQAYFVRHQLAPYQQVVAIGKSTFSFLQSIDIKSLIMASASNEQAMVNAVLRLCE